MLQWTGNPDSLLKGAESACSFQSTEENSAVFEPISRLDGCSVGLDSQLMFQMRKPSVCDSPCPSAIR